MNRMLLPAAVIAALFAKPLLAHEDDAAAGQSQFGKVNFPTSCSAAVQPQFERAVAMLHSFFFPEHIKAFQAVIKADPQCAMAYWGLAISQRGNPLVPPWPEENLKRALEAIQQGKAVAKYPDDKEASIFYALALLEAVDHADKTYARQLKAGGILEPIDRQQPAHPGLAHYIIHTYDFEPLAVRGVAAADKYAKVAPAAPHAQHMPSHIYSILGRWEDSIRSNTSAVKASRDYAAKNAPGTTFAQEPHAQDFMAYAYLQLGQDREARRVIDELRAVTKLSGARSYGADTGRMAPASRYVLERGAWAEAATLEVPSNLYTYAEAMPRFTRAVGAAKTGSPATAKEEIDRLQGLSKSAENGYWGEQIQVLVLAASAWRAHAEGRKDDALKLMRGAADLEDSTEKHVSMENRLYPMREMLGDLLLDLGQPAAALQAYEASLHVAQNRLRGFYGAAKAARAAGDRSKARTYFEKLAALAKNADTDRAELREAKAFLLAQR